MPDALKAASQSLDWRRLHWLWIALAVLLLDQWTKGLVAGSLRLYEQIELLPFFNITLAYNEGAAFSFLAGAGGWQRWFFSIVAVVASVVILVWLLRGRDGPVVATALSLILGGALGNLWDRIVLGHVVDFLDFHWAGWHFPAFNVADSAITVGAALIIIDMLFGGHRHD
ncbi:signal peptidase II [Alcanivorax quisquiliarum]|uniref:Lipoprotein signal peptidase n=1 Tax=Alcanivorax quisquiliarum TaxID=2933565 RepID=A0ABT0E9R8_9GAMM|nr:signal peptidase II [Alcanivorax quisquiliarum]MCK0538502.1 signal peptidase II [Alcanivorax quisquiliarum]